MASETDQQTSVSQLRELVGRFVEERDWEQFHTPKNISMALCIEAAELMEHFQWLTPEESRAVSRQDDKRHAVGEEMADVLCYLLALANELEIDLATAMRQKMVKNIQKYPAEEFRGRYGPEDPREPGVETDSD